MERRYVKHELRLIEEPDRPPVIRGYAAVFNRLSEEMWGFREMILPGFFSDVLDDDVRGLFNHDPNMILGRSPDTLTLVEDEVGLSYEIQPPDTQYARDLLVSLRRGDVDQSSFGFEVAVDGDEWEKATEARPYPIRKLVKAARLWDVSPVTFPAYPSTTVGVRQLVRSLGGVELAGGQAPGAGEVLADGRAAGRLALRRRRIELMRMRG